MFFNIYEFSVQFPVNAAVYRTLCGPSIDFDA
jgi:hypothetical protein